jgi:hypothetical protein
MHDKIGHTERDCANPKRDGEDNRELGKNNRHPALSNCKSHCPILYRRDPELDQREKERRKSWKK